jgi:serine/threonine protein kinase
VLDDGLVKWEGATAPFYVMPLYVGTLRDDLNRGMQPEKVLPAFSQILDGVEAAHLQGIFHRDLKPENVLVDENGKYAVADFGIAHFEEAELLTAVETQSHERLANFVYAAPEQRIKDRKVTLAADLYALGLLLNEMYTGEVIQGTGFKRIAPVSQSHSYLDEVVEKLVQNNPDARYDSIDGLKKELIGRRNMFVAQQELSRVSGSVVPKFAPGLVEPVELVSVNWVDDVLEFGLNRFPDSGWVQRFQNPREGYSSLMGAEPGRFAFSGTRVSIPAHERNAETILSHIKQYVAMANRGFQQDFDADSANREQLERQKLEATQRAAEARVRVLAKLKL